MITVKNIEGLPFEYEPFLLGRYESYVTTCRYVEIFYPAWKINYMIVFEDDRLVDLLVFGNNGKTSKCFNLFTEFDQNVLEECISKQFEEYPYLTKIEFGASYKSYDLKKSFLVDKTNDYVLQLPTNNDNYMLELGQSTRKNVKKQKSRLLKDHSGAEFVVKFGSEIEKKIVDKVVQLNIDRMKEKGIIHKAHFSAENLYRYLQYYGLAVYLEIDGEIVAGTISGVVNKRLFGFIIGHDSRFSKYSVGLLTQIFEIQVCIDRGISAIHFLWGDNDYKTRLLGKRHALYSYLIYRKYSFDFIYNKYKAMFHSVYIRIRKSKFSTPVKNFIKKRRRTA